MKKPCKLSPEKRNQMKVVKDRAISISNKINLARVMHKPNMKLIDYEIGIKMIKNFAKENDLDIIVAANRLAMQVSQNTYKGDTYDEVK